MNPEPSPWRYNRAIFDLRCTGGNRPQPTRRRPEPGLAGDERRVLALLAAGATHETAARHLGVSPRTVRRRVETIRIRLGVATMIETVVWAAKHGLL